MIGASHAGTVGVSPWGVAPAGDPGPGEGEPGVAVVAGAADTPPEAIVPIPWSAAAGKGFSVGALGWSTLKRMPFRARRNRTGVPHSTDLLKAVLTALRASAMAVSTGYPDERDS